MSLLERFFFPHRVTVRELLPPTGMGGGFADPREITAEVRDEQRLVRDADGNEVVSSTIVTVHLGEHVPAGSLVTVWPGTANERDATVLAVGRDENDPPLPSHQILSLE